MIRRPVALLLVVALAGAVVGPSVGASDSYAIATDPSVPVPERTIERSGDEYTVDAIARVGPNGTLQVNTDVPAGTVHTVYLYNAEKTIEQSERGTGDLQYSIDAEPLSEGAGTYLLVLEEDTIRTVHPVVVSAYSVSIETPKTVTAGTAVDVSGGITSLVNNSSEPTIKLVLGNESARVTTTATLDDTTDPTTFAGSLSTDGLGAGTYSVYAVVQGPDTAFGETEMIGLSDAAAVDVETASDDDPDGVQTTTQSTTTTMTTTVTTSETGSTTTTETPTTGETSTSPTTSTEATTPTTSTSHTTTASTTSTTPVTTDTSVVLTPTQSTTSPTSTTPTETPLFGPLTVLGLLAGLALVGYRIG